MTVSLSMLAGAGAQILDDNGTPLAGGFIYTYFAGTTSDATTFTTSAGHAGGDNANPIVLDAAGRVPYQIWLTDGVSYKFVVKTSGGVTVRTYDSIYGAQNGNLPGLLTASSGSSLIGFLGSLADEQQTTVENILKNYVTSKRFGVVGDGTTDDTDAIQNFLNSGAGLLILQKGTFKITGPVSVPDNTILVGVGGYAGSLFSGTHAGNILEHGFLRFFSMYGVAFTGNGCTAMKQTSFVSNYYNENLTVDHCHFYGNLTECIYGDLIFADIKNSTFGFYGTVGAAHRHIVSLGTGGGSPNLANLNKITRNRFYNALGNESVRADNGVNYEFTGNNWEANEALPLRLNGVIAPVIRHCWFENNAVTTSEIEINQGSSGVVIDSTPTTIEHCTFYPNASVTELVKINNVNTKVYFDRNIGLLGTATISNDDTKVYSKVGNNITGYTDGDLFRTNGVQFSATQIASSNANTLDDYEEGTWVPVDASGAGLSLVGSGKYVKIGKIVTLTECAVTYPATASGASAKIGGLPFASAGISVLNNIDNTGLSITFATDASTTFTPYTNGTLAIPTNANLSGKIIYLSGSYTV